MKNYASAISTHVSIHPMLLFIRYAHYSSNNSQESVNTSHVIVHLGKIAVLPETETSVNTSHVIVHHNSPRPEKYADYSVNTSHVIVHLNLDIDIDIPVEKCQYIPCYCSS